MSAGIANIRDRRGAAQRILDQVRRNGCLPRYANFKTVNKLKEAGAISFHGGRYHLGPKPKMREPGYYWVKSDGWEVVEWNGSAWFCINGQRPHSDDEFDIIGEKIERSRFLEDFVTTIEKMDA